MNFVNNTIKLNNIKAYNTVGLNANQAFKKNFYSKSKEIDNTVYESIDYNSIDLKAGIENSKNKKEWYEKTFDILKTIRDYGTTFELSLVCGALELVENVGDALIMCGGEIASGVVSIWDEDQAKKIKEGAAEAVKYDWSEALYDASVDLLNVDDEIAHGITHTIGSTIGTAAAYTAISCIPGGAAVTASVGAVTAFGSASEMALNSGASFDGAFTCGAVAGIAGAVTGGALNKIQGAAAGATSIAQVGGYTLAGMGISALEPVINTTTQYFAYGKDVVDENGNKVYSDYLDYYNKSGGLLQTGIASIVGGTSTGMKAYKGYNKFSEREIEYMNGKTTLVDDITINRVMDATSGRGSLSESYTIDQVVEGVYNFEIEYPGKTVTDIIDDPEFREMVLDQYTINSASETAVLGKWKPKDDSFSYTALANDSSFNSTYFEYGDRAAALEGVLGEEGTYEYLNRPYLENIISEAQSGNKSIILTTGPDSIDWATGFYGKELSNISDILGLQSIDELSTYLKKVEVEIKGTKGYVYEIDFGLLNIKGGMS